jgi:general secretion pathway protein H
MSSRDKPCRGFTLLELLVVVFVIGIIATMFTLSVGTAGGSDREMRRETERLESLVRLAIEDAGFQGRELGIRLYPQKYEFAALDIGELRDPTDDKWIVIDDDTLAARELPAAFELELEIEGRAVNLERSARDVEKRYVPQLFIFSSGDISDAFDIRIRSRDDGRGVRLSVAADGATEIHADG